MSHRTRLITTGVTSAVTLPRAPMKGTTAVEQMADDMRIVNTRVGTVTVDDLSLIGWTRTQLEKHGQAARELAASQSLVMV